MRTTKMLSLVIYFLISLSAISQTTDFSEEENQYVKSVLIEIDSTEEITYKETIERLEDELRKLPRHPDLVFPYLRMNDVTGRSETASNYCQEQLGNNYLKKNQDILKKCIECAITNGDLEYAKPIIELVDDLTAQDLIKASIALENNIEEFKTLGMKGINNDYVTLNKMKYNVLNHLVAIYYAENNLGKIDLILDKYLDMYLEKPEKLSTGFDALVILYLRASENEDFKKGLKIMKMAEVIYEEDELLLSFFKAKALAAQGHTYLAEEAIKGGLKVSEEEINNRLSYTSNPHKSTLKNKPNPLGERLPLVFWC